MGIYYQRFMIWLRATRLGHWAATVSPFPGAGGWAAARPQDGELVGKFQTREEAVEAARRFIRDKQLQSSRGSTPHPNAKAAQDEAASGMS